LNLLYSPTTKRRVNIGGKNTITVLSGDKLTILTPGGGGYGHVEDSNTSSTNDSNEKKEIDVPRLITGSLNQYTLNQESV
jgi:5-oxoprolinase (ATP-hydrolysing)